MAIKMAQSTRNAMLDAIETDLGTSPLLKMFTGAPPTNVGDADSGTKLADMTLPSDWMAAASGGAKSKSGTWSDTSADAAGTLGYFRLYTSGAVCKFQGTITGTGGGGDMEVDDTTTEVGQTVTVTTFTLTAPHNGG